MAFSETWDGTFEGLPADNEAANLGAGRIRNLKRDIRERTVVEHSWAGDANDGKHTDINPTSVTTSGITRFNGGVAGRLAKKTAVSNILSGTVTLQSLGSWQIHTVRIDVASVKANSAGGCAAWYLYRILTLDGNAGSATLAASGGDTASFVMALSGDSGTGSQVWTVQATGPAANDRVAMLLDVATSTTITAMA